MAEQVVESIDISAVKAGQVEAKKDVATATVSAPRVADLVEKTGEALIKEADAKDKYGEYTPVQTEEVSELKSQISKYKDEIKALQNSKMLYAENSRTSHQFSEKEMANAVLLAKMLNKRDVFDTKFGNRMKAVTTVDQFLSNFSQNIYTEMEQQLVIAPMFTRLPVDAKTFRVPVADEDKDGDVAMFRSGSYATGIGDTTNVPTSNQNSIGAVEFTPHKFMATTHLAKDEEEDTVLPLLDFLRAAATRRLARAIDKSILRGTGALTGFTASPTNAITAGTGYASVIEGITNLTADASLTVPTGSSTDKVDPSDIAAARTAMGKYGLQLGNDLVYITSIEGYNNLVTTADFRTVDKFGPNATYLTGSVGAVYGIPIAISEFLDNVGSTGNHLGVLLYKPGFLIAERRGIEIESEYEPRQQVTAMYMSTRFDFKALTTNSSAALDSSKYAYAVTVTAG
jgi:HK97 family phage major capsid protein